MVKGWSRESRRHSLAARGVSTTRAASQTSMTSFSQPSRASQYVKQIGDSPFKLEASDSWAWLTELHNRILRGEETGFFWRKDFMTIEQFAKLEYDIMIKNGSYVGLRPPEFEDWLKAKRESEITAHSLKRMKSGELAPVPTIDKHADGTVYGADGIHRAMAAKELGYDFIPVVTFTEKSPIL